MSEDQFPQDPKPNSAPTPPPFKPPVHHYGEFGQQSLPNSTPVLVLGILSILSCCCYGVPGLILGIIGLVLGNKDRRLFREDPGFYTDNSYKNSKAGRICSIIGLILSALYILLIIGMIIIFGFSTLQNPEAMREMLEHMKNQ